MPTQRDSLDEAAMKVSLGKACVSVSIYLSFINTLEFKFPLATEIRGKWWANVGSKPCIDVEIRWSFRTACRVLFSSFCLLCFH